MRFTPHTYSWAAIASIMNVSGIAILAPKVKEFSSQLTDNKTAQTLIALFLSSSAVSGVTTPINTLGGRYLKSLEVNQTDWRLAITPTQSLMSTAQNVMKDGLKQGLKTLFKPYPLTVGMTFLSYGCIEVVNRAVDALLSDQVMTSNTVSEEEKETPEAKEDSLGFVNVETSESKTADQETFVSNVLNTLSWISSTFTHFLTTIQEHNAQVTNTSSDNEDAEPAEDFAGAFRTVSTLSISEDRDETSSSSLALEADTLEDSTPEPTYDFMA
jgi:hypothetical protein